MSQLFSAMSAPLCTQVASLLREQKKVRGRAKLVDFTKRNASDTTMANLTPRSLAQRLADRAQQQQQRSSAAQVCGGRACYRLISQLLSWLLRAPLACV